MERRKKGLLPKWIYLGTVIKLIYMIFITLKTINTVLDETEIVLGKRKPKDFFNLLVRSYNWFYILHFVLVFLRLVSIRKICDYRFFIFITLSFGIDILFCFMGRIFYTVFLFETVCEVLFSFVSIACMVFLYPYYLYDVDEKIKDA